MKTNQQNTKKEKPMQKSKADRTADGKKQHSGKTALRAKKESILTWTALPAKYYSADDRVRFVVKTAETQVGHPGCQLARCVCIRSELVHVDLDRLR